MDVRGIYNAGKEEGLTQDVIIGKIADYLEFIRSQEEILIAAVADVCELDLYLEVVECVRQRMLASA
jgi:hypothetical protein